MNIEIEFRCQPSRAQHPHRIFFTTHHGIANQSEDTVVEVIQPTDIIEHSGSSQRVVERIDGEIPTYRVILDRAEHIVAQDSPTLPDLAACATGMICSEGRDFDHVTTKQHMYQPEAPANNARIAE